MKERKEGDTLRQLLVCFFLEYINFSLYCCEVYNNENRKKNVKLILETAFYYFSINTHFFLSLYIYLKRPTYEHRMRGSEKKNSLTFRTG